MTVGERDCPESPSASMSSMSRGSLLTGAKEKDCEVVDLVRLFEWEEEMSLVAGVVRPSA
jgi:hypothetical protein